MTIFRSLHTCRWARPIPTVLGHLRFPGAAFATWIGLGPWLNGLFPIILAQAPTASQASFFSIFWKLFVKWESNKYNVKIIIWKLLSHSVFQKLFSHCFQNKNKIPSTKRKMLRTCLIGGFLFLFSKKIWNIFQKIEIKASFQIIVFILYVFGSHI